MGQHAVHWAHIQFILCMFQSSGALSQVHASGFRFSGGWSHTLSDSPQPDSLRRHLQRFYAPEVP